MEGPRAVFTASGPQRTSSRQVRGARREAPRPRPGGGDVSMRLEPTRIFFLPIDRSPESKRIPDPAVFQSRPSTSAAAAVS
jgi:hypothetical protein